jgi:D-glycero-D-manno-heptose 1,7-bisphosphate phosphatase
MILKAQAELGIDLAASALVGDRETDIRAAMAAGVGSKLLIPHHEEDPAVTEADAVVGSLGEAVDWLAAGCGKR